MKARPIKEQLPMEPSQFLSGWKEIATYLGKGVRTVQRYERHLGLPIRRPAGKSAGSVVATRAELDAWVKASPIREVYSLNNPLPEYEYSNRTMKKSLSEMRRLRDQMFSLRKELSNSLSSLRASLESLSDNLWENRLIAIRADALVRDEERASLDEPEINSPPPGRNISRVS